MALDFPSGPGLVNGQIYTSGWASWVWDGVKWMAGVPGPGVYVPLFGGPQYPMTGFLYQQAAGDPGNSTVWAGIGATRWRFKQTPGDDFAAGSIDYCGYNGNALSIVGAGTATGNRQIYLYDNVAIAGAISIGGTTALNGGVQVTGDIHATGANAQISWDDRTVGGVTWSWYSSGGISRLYQAGDRLSVDQAGNLSAQANLAVGGLATIAATLRTGGDVAIGSNNLYFRNATFGSASRLTNDGTNFYFVLPPGAGSFYVFDNASVNRFQVTSAGDTLTGTLRLSNTTDFGTSQTTGSLSSKILHFATSFSDDAAAGSIGFRIYDANALAIVGAGTSPNRLVHVWDNLTVDRNLTVSGSFSASGATTINGTATVNLPALGTAAYNTVMGLELQTASANDDDIEFLWSRTADGGDWTTADFIMRRNVDSTNNQGSIVFTGQGGFQIVTAYNWRLAIDTTNFAFKLPANNGAFYWYGAFGSSVASLDNGGFLTLSHGVRAMGYDAWLQVDDRTAGITWGIYGTSNALRLWKSDVGDRFMVDHYGNASILGDAIVTGNVRFANYLQFLGATVGSGPFISADATNMVFRIGSSGGSFLFQNYSGSNNANLTSGGHLYLTQNISVANYLFFRNQASTGPYILADATNVIVRVGPSNGGFYVQDVNGSNKVWTNNAGTLWATGDTYVTGNIHCGNGILFLGHDAWNPPYIFTDGNHYWFRSGLNGNWNFQDSAGNIPAYIAAGGNFNCKDVRSIGYVTSQGLYLTPAGSYIYFCIAQGSGGGGEGVVPQIAVNATDFYIRVGNGNGGHYFQNADGSWRARFTADQFVLYGSDARNALVICKADQTSYLTLIPEYSANTAIIGYYNGSVGWMTIRFPGPVSLDGALYIGGNISVNQLNVRSTNIGMAGYTGGLGGTGGPIYYADANWFVLKCGSGNLGFMLYDTAGAARITLRTSGDIWATGTGTLGQYRMTSTTGANGYGSAWYNDGATTYLLLTNNNDAAGGYNSLRPFVCDNATGSISFGHVFSTNAYAYLNAGCRVYNGGSDPLLVLAPNGAHARALFESSGTRTWSFGTVSWGSFYIGDETAGRQCLEINTAGTLIFGNANVDAITVANTIIMPNQHWLYWKDSVGTSQAVLTMWGDNAVYLCESGRPLHLRGTPLSLESSDYIRSGQTIIVPNGSGYGAYDTGGVARAIISMGGNDAMYYGDGTHTLYCNGPWHPVGNGWQTGYASEAWSNVYSYAFTQLSDRRFKTEIEDLPNGCLDLVCNIVPKRFRLTRSDDRTRHWGFMAQDVGEVMAAAGHEFGGYIPDEEGDALGLGDMTALLWRAVQELRAEVKELKAKQSH